MADSLARSEAMTSDQWLAERRQRAQEPEPVEETVQPDPSIPDDDETAPEDDLTFVDEGAHSEGEPEESPEPEESAEETVTLTHIREVADSAGLDLNEVLDSMQVEVPINGKKETVILREALEGYSRNADYGRKTRELAEERKSFQEQRGQAENALVQKLNNADTMLQMLAEDLQLYDPQAINQLVQEDPETGMRLKSEMDLKMQRYQAVAAQKQQMEAQQAEQQRSQIADYRRQQQDQLVTHFPEVRDAAKASTFETEMREFLPNYGYSDAEISEFFSGPWDHRQIRLIRAAMDGANVRKAAEKKLKPKRKAKAISGKGSARKSSIPSDNQALDDARSNLRKGGSTGDAIALLQARRSMRNGGGQS